MQLGVFELEGEHDFVGSYLDKLIPIMETVRVRPKTVDDRNNEGVPEVDRVDSDTLGDNQKLKRKVTKRAPAGSSCRDRLLTLKPDGYFKDHRSPSDIVAALGKKGWTHNVNQVSAALGQMFTAGEIQRTRNDQGRGFAYFWDRE